MKNQTAPQPEIKMAVANPFPGSLSDPAVWDRANAAVIAARPPSEPRDFDLLTLQSMLSTIEENRAHYLRILGEAESDLSALDDRETAAKEVLKRFANRIGHEPRVTIEESRDALEEVAERRTNAKRRQRQAETMLADCDRKEEEFPRALYERLIQEDRVTRAMRRR